MSIVTERSIHQRLLIASYILGAVSSLLGTLAAIGVTLERNELYYPPINTPPPHGPAKTPEPRRYFDQ